MGITIKPTTSWCLVGHSVAQNDWILTMAGSNGLVASCSSTQETLGSLNAQIHPERFPDNHSTHPWNVEMSQLCMCVWLEPPEMDGLTLRIANFVGPLNPNRETTHASTMRRWKQSVYN